MRGVNVSMMVLGILTVLLLGLLGLAGAISPGLFTAWGDFFGGPVALALDTLTGRVIALVWGGVILAVLAYYGWAAVRKSQRERTVVLKSPLGDVLVSLPAIEDFARVLRGKIEGLREIKGRVWYTRKGLKVTARIVVFSDVSLIQVTEKVQMEVLSYIQKTLNITQPIQPKVIVTKVVAREKPLTMGGGKEELSADKGSYGSAWR
ncbi:MAG: alkaline shock response membrane anchor protein AmaP [candidate division FCPU426 bacterium]